MGALKGADQNGSQIWNAEFIGSGESCCSLAIPPTHRRRKPPSTRHLPSPARQSAKSWELRAALSLGRLWRRQGKRDEARQLLRGIHDWFTEGFETADLREARMVLDELAVD